MNTAQYDCYTKLSYVNSQGFGCVCTQSILVALKHSPPCFQHVKQLNHQISESKCILLEQNLLSKNTHTQVNAL